MQVTIGSKCWDGFRSKSLVDNSVKKELSKFQEAVSFVNRSKLKTALGYSIPFAFVAAGGQRVFAAPEAIPAMAISDGLKATILHAFDPLIDLIVTLSYPIAGVMIAGGCLFIMVGNRERGMQMLQNAAIGYILVQLSPMLLKLLVGIGGSI